MKKSIAIVFGLLCAVNSLLAAYQYGDSISLNESTGRLVISATADITLNFQDAAAKGVTRDFGDITQWDTLTVVATDAQGNERTNTVNITGSSVNIGTVYAGETLKFVLSGSSDGGSYTFDHFWGTGGTATGYQYLVFGGNYGKNSQFYATFGFSAVSIAGGDAPTGQPLPGVIAALLCGGGALGVLRLKKRKA